MQRFLFLDIDGVLNTDATYNGFYRAMGLSNRQTPRDASPTESQVAELLISPECMFHLNQILRLSGARVVLSSTWREPQNLWGLDAMEILVESGIYTPIFDVTAPAKQFDCAGVYYRGAEVCEYVTRKGLVPEQYVVLDDNFAPGKILKQYLGHKGVHIRTSHRKGLTRKHVTQVLHKWSLPQAALEFCANNTLTV